MKTSIFLLILLFLAINNLAQAEEMKTPVKYSAETMQITGQARRSTAISAIVFYTPLSRFDKNISSKDCQFPEDHWSPNGADRTVTIKAEKSSDGAYALKIPVEGQRGKCDYVIDSMYMGIEDGEVTQSLNLLTERNIKDQNETIAESGDKLEVKDFSQLKTIFCEFKSEYSTGFCYSVNDSIDLQYAIANKGINYTLDIQDIAAKPPRQY